MVLSEGHHTFLRYRQITKSMANKVTGCYLSTPHYGNQLFAECEGLYRVPNFRHSAKTCFAECRTRQNLALGKEVFAKPGTRQMQSLPR
jgi:hypothetical protein